MANILTAAEAAIVLRCEQTDTNMLQLLPFVDTYIKIATGRDWTLDSTINPAAKAAARILIVRWHEDPGGMAAGASMGFGLSACLTQLEALALTLATNGVPDDELEITASMPANGSDDNAVTVKPVVIFNHDMASGVSSVFSLASTSGTTVAVTAALDATKRIVTVTPATNLQADTTYTLSITAAPDTYGQTLTDTIGFTTA